jgi:hypothetical protein
MFLEYYLHLLLASYEIGLVWSCRGQLKCDGTRAETRFCLSGERTFKSAGASVQSTAGSRGVRISGSNAGYTMLRVSVKGTVYPLHSPVSPSFPLPCVTVCHHILTGVYPFVAFFRARQTKSVRRLWKPNPGEYSRVSYFSVAPFGCAQIRRTVIFF